MKGLKRCEYNCVILDTGGRRICITMLQCCFIPIATRWNSCSHQSRRMQDPFRLNIQFWQHWKVNKKCPEGSERRVSSVRSWVVSWSIHANTTQSSGSRQVNIRATESDIYIPKWTRALCENWQTHTNSHKLTQRRETSGVKFKWLKLVRSLSDFVARFV
jgi:hypothetical protein